MVTELKPCPFCGGTDLRVVDPPVCDEWVVECACDANGPIANPTPEDAIETWNMRAGGEKDS